MRQLGLGDFPDVDVTLEREPEPDAPQLALGDFDVAVTVVTENGETVVQEALTSERGSA